MNYKKTMLVIMVAFSAIEIRPNLWNRFLGVFYTKLFITSPMHYKIPSSSNQASSSYKQAPQRNIRSTYRNTLMGDLSARNSNLERSVLVAQRFVLNPALFKQTQPYEYEEPALKEPSLEVINSLTEQCKKLYESGECRPSAEAEEHYYSGRHNLKNNHL